MGNEDKIHDRATIPQKSGESWQDALHRQRLRRQFHQPHVYPNKQTLGHIPPVAPSEQDPDTESASQAGPTVHNSTAVAGAQRAGTKGQNPRFQPLSQTSSGTQKASQPISSRRPKNPSGLPECYLHPNVQAAFATKIEHAPISPHFQECAREVQAREDRRIAMAAHNVAAPCYQAPPIIRNVRIHARPTSLNSQCGTVLANEHDYLVREEESHDEGEWDRCLSSPNERDDCTHARPTSLNSQCGTVLANEHDYFAKGEGCHDEAEWDRCEMSSSEEN